MRSRVILLAAALLASWVPAAGAQPATGQQPGEQAQTPSPWQLTLSNWIDLGARGTSISGDESKFERYRDVRDEPHFSNRHNVFEAEATISALRAVTFGAGYRYNRVSCTEREVTRTNDHGVFVTADSMSLGLVSLHGVYEHDRRRSPDFGSLALADLPEQGEYPGLRRYDIADRDRGRVTAMLQVMPVSSFAISGSVTATRDKFPNGEFSTPDAFGLQRVTTQGYSIFFDATPSDTVTFGAGYGFQKYSSLQQSRRVDSDPATPTGQAQQANPNRDWSLNEDEKVHYVAANVELANIVPKTSVRFAWDYNRAESPYIYTVGTALAAPNQLPTVLNRWHTATFDVRYFFHRNFAAGFTCWFGRYTVDDVALGPQITDNVAIPGLVLLGYGYRPYRADSFWGRLLVVF